MSAVRDANQIRKRGGVVELRFWMEATRRGVIVSKPHEVARYDFIVDCGRRLYRVQVKSTTVKVCHQYKLAMFTSPSKKSYTKEEVDFVAAYVIPEEAWYIFPLSEVLGKKFARLGPRTPLAKYRDAWYLLLNKSKNVVIDVMRAEAGRTKEKE
jgi:hypothetical protein